MARGALAARELGLALARVQPGDALLGRVLDPALIERSSEPLLRPQSDDQEVGLIGVLVGGHPAILGIDHGDDLMPELDPLL